MFSSVEPWNVTGPVEVTACERMLKSREPFVHHLGSLVTRDLALPELRSLYHLGLTSSSVPAVRLTNLTGITGRKRRTVRWKSLREFSEGVLPTPECGVTAR